LSTFIAIGARCGTALPGAGVPVRGQSTMATFFSVVVVDDVATFDDPQAASKSPHIAPARTTEFNLRMMNVSTVFFGPTLRRAVVPMDLQMVNSTF
jgi:hypothetical protein